ncbi:hypothetical protein CDCA_CDCA04G1354 [Cyanidium caldarium]|uniref:Dolichyl-diphosphooligosaccharide--protein glycosyltransferase 48 kDa subunit n=1 Tax=Cyanidium caldarium TaxID=2771 RepID=A0AAV9ISW1_CYACA|nr:hypothetical protein CDCA_CDCA04G1354 [Cyanidium caldarium]
MDHLSRSPHRSHRHISPPPPLSARTVWCRALCTALFLFALLGAVLSSAPVAAAAEGRSGASRCDGSPIRDGWSFSRHISTRGTPPVGRRVLVIVDDAQPYSRLFQLLQEAAYQLEVRSPSDRSVRLRNAVGTEYLYDALLLMEPGMHTFGDSLRVQDVVDFVDANRSVVLAAAAPLGPLMEGVAEATGLEVDEAGTVLLDYVHAVRPLHSGRTNAWGETFAVRPEACGIAGRMTASRILPRGMPERPVVFSRAIGAAAKAGKELVRPVLCAPATAHSYEPHEVITSDEDAAPFVAGREALLVSALHARFGARVTFVASVDALRDEYLSSGEYGNADFFLPLLTWTLGERGLLRIAAAEHYRVLPDGGRQHADRYRVGDTVRLEMRIEEWDGAKDAQHWQPWNEAPDLQLEWVMLDPYVRHDMRRVDDRGTYVAEFATPMKHGLFKFRVEHFRDGYTPLLYARVVPMQPFWHNEYQRFLVKAYPYYAAVFAVMAAFWLLAYALLWGKSFMHLRPPASERRPSLTLHVKRE